jgi:hypothetical protein
MLESAPLSVLPPVSRMPSGAWRSGALSVRAPILTACYHAIRISRQLRLKEVISFLALLGWTRVPRYKLFIARSVFRSAAAGPFGRDKCMQRTVQHALADWAPQLLAPDAQKLVRLVRQYGIEIVIAATKARGFHRANSCRITRASAQLADVVVPMLRRA